MRRFLALGLAFFLLFPAVISTAASSDEEFLTAHGILEEGEKTPVLENSLHRAEWVKWVLRADGFTGEQKGAAPFRDVQNDPYVAEAWRREAVKTALTFAPRRPVTVAEALKILFKVKKIPFTPQQAAGKWKDLPEDEELRGILLKAAETGIWKPVSTEEFGSTKRLSRIQGIALLSRALSPSLSETKPVPVESTYTINLSSSAEKEKRNEEKKFDYIWEELHKHFLYTDRIDDRKMMEEAIKGFVESLGDEYTEYLKAPERKEFAEDFTGELEGIGANLGIPPGQESGVMVTQIFPVTPAEGADLEVGDLLLTVDGVDVTAKIPQEVVPLVRGTAGTIVKIRLRRGGQEKEISITRQKIRISYVEVKREKEILILRILIFGQNTAPEFKKALETHMQDPTVKGIIVDLRDNPGGDLDGTRRMLGLFLPPESAVTWYSHQENLLKQEVITTREPFLEIPLVVLVNKNSASASEIFAAAIQEYRRGKVVGTKTFGKGVAQTYMEFSDGSALKYTFAKWLTPRKVSIDGVGLTPDVTVTPEEGRDNTLEVGKSLIKGGQAKPVLPLTLSPAE